MKIKKGFTLVELSIVLVIIGLLIGGILAAQSMISTAKIQGVVRQLQQYDVAVANFQTKYEQLPGDSNLFGTGGDNDGRISEWTKAWYQLSLGVGLQSAAKQDFIIATVPVTDAMCPTLNIEHKGTPHLIIYYGGSSKNQYYYDPNPGASGVYDPLKPVTTLSLDQKIDDGIYNTGRMAGITYGSATSTSCVYGTGTLDDGYNCSFKVDLGSFTAN